MLIGMQEERALNILGVSKDASHDEIVRAWRSKARKFHPDMNRDSNAETNFKEVQLAYCILVEEAQRKSNAGDVSNHSSQVSETESLNKLDSGESMYLRFIRDNNWTLSQFWTGKTITLHFMDPLQGVDEELTFQWWWRIRVKYSDGSYFPIARGPVGSGFGRTVHHRHGEIVFTNGASYFVYLRLGLEGFYAINIQDKPNLSSPQIRTKWWFGHNKRRFRHRYAREASR